MPSLLFDVHDRAAMSGAQGAVCTLSTDNSYTSADRQYSKYYAQSVNKSVQFYLNH